MALLNFREADWFAVVALFRQPLGLPIPQWMSRLARFRDWRVSPF